MWLRNAVRITGTSAGAMNGDGSRKLLLHSTEGSTIEGALAAYRAHNSWPHLTVDCPRRRIVQHLPLNVAARSLRNMPGGVDATNKDGDVLVQIEMVGTATQPTTLGSPEDLIWFAEQVVQPICKALDIPMRSTVRWVSYPASYGTQAPQRLSPAAWDAYSGILGHQHAADNDHGDPGSIDIAWILRAATEEEDDMTEAQLNALVERTAKKVVSLLNAEYKRNRSTIRSETRELAKLGAQDALDAHDVPEPPDASPPS